jgi:hypothetical protein
LYTSGTISTASLTTSLPPDVVKYGALLPDDVVALNAYDIHPDPRLVAVIPERIMPDYELSISRHVQEVKDQPDIPFAVLFGARVAVVFVDPVPLELVVFFGVLADVYKFFPHETAPGRAGVRHHESVSNDEYRQRLEETTDRGREVGSAGSYHGVAEFQALGNAAFPQPRVEGVMVSADIVHVARVFDDELQYVIQNGYGSVGIAHVAGAVVVYRVSDEQERRPSGIKVFPVVVMVHYGLEVVQVRVQVADDDRP